MPVGKNANGEWVDPTRGITGNKPTNAPRKILPKCSNSPTGKHEPDFHTITQADLPPEKMILDVNCKHCGISGSFRVPTEIDW